MQVDNSPARSSVADTDNERSIFSDPSGSRWRRMRIIGSIILLPIIVGLVASFSCAFCTPGSTPANASELTMKDTGKHTPVVGSGPLERVLRVERSGGHAQGIEPFTGQRVATFSAREMSVIQQAPYAIQRYGYATNTQRVISLTFDDGPDSVITPVLLDVLSRNHVPATFFVQGRNAVKAPEVLRRMDREGHAIGIHTLTHPNVSELPSWREQAELVGTERIIRSITGHQATMWRMPYTSPVLEEEQATITGLLRGQRLGYLHASYDFDTLDWLNESDPHATSRDIPLPDLTSGQNLTLLMHDAGGPNRMRSVEYVQRLIDAARAQGYTFTTMVHANPPLLNANDKVATSFGDAFAYRAAQVLFDWPNLVMRALFILAVISVVGFGAFNMCLVVWRKHRRSKIMWPQPDQLGVSVSVILAAYNEEAVIARTLRSILASEYPIEEIVIVNDGSVDNTAEQVRRVQAEDSRVVLVNQPNGGKAKALNRAVTEARGEVLVTLDADTIVTPQTVTNLVRHFAIDASGRLGAVAGVVRVGNRTKNLQTRWQSLEYLTQIGLERSAQDALGAISIIPGACAAWRKSAVVEVGGYACVTLAEDCDLALTLHSHDWRVTQDDEAYAYTEAPEDLDSLLKQRERWTYGTLQAMFKHRRMIFNCHRKALGLYVLPNYVASIVVPYLFLPFVAVMTWITLQSGGGLILIEYALLFLLIHLLTAAITIKMMGEDWRQLWAVPLYRVINDPLRAYLLYTSVNLAIRGGRMGWNKLERTGSMDAVAIRPAQVSAGVGAL